MGDGGPGPNVGLSNQGVGQKQDYLIKTNEIHNFVVPGVGLSNQVVGQKQDSIHFHNIKATNPVR